MARRDAPKTPADCSGAPDWLDRDDPYDGVATDELPDWWADAVAEFRAHDLRPYRPARFADDTPVPPVVARLETAHGVDIRLAGVGVQHGDAWGCTSTGTGWRPSTGGARPRANPVRDDEREVRGGGPGARGEEFAEGGRAHAAGTGSNG